GTERKSHVMDLVDDQGLALFAGLNVAPKRSHLAAYSSQIDDRTTQRLLAAWFTEVQRAGLTRGSSLDLDFHTAPAHTADEPLENPLLCPPQPQPAGHPDLPGPGRQPARPLLRPGRHHQGRATRGDPALRRFLGAADRRAAAGTGLRLAPDHLPVSRPAQPTP